MFRNSFTITLLLVLPTIYTEVINNNNTSTSSGFRKDGQHNQSKEITLPAEGGLQIIETPTANVGSNIHDLYSINEEQGKEKLSSSKGRKGAVMNISTSKEMEPPDASFEKNVPVTNILNTTNSRYNYSSSSQPVTNSSVNKIGSDKADKASSTEHIKKPQILSYEALSNAKVSNLKKESSSMNPKTSSKPVEYDQLPSPQDSIHVGAKTNKPEMIVPLVITILVLPVLAFLGYMGLIKGREAWKNRHYKRMDFLLDGMYND